MRQGKDTGKMTPAEIRRAAYGAIARELGPSGLFRFIQDFSLGHGDYTMDRHAFLPKGDVEEIVGRIQTWRGVGSRGKRKRDQLMG
ncbi:MAG: hypothetical protein GHCLOJNM_03446 [bacterium]|nr:hypothetical protein [bacterium]